MEFPVLLEMPLPAPARKLITLFMRPHRHPVAFLINILKFEQHDEDYDSDEMEIIHAAMIITGFGIRRLDLSLWPPTYCIWGRTTVYNDWHTQCAVPNLAYSYDPITGESNFKSKYDIDTDDEDVESEEAITGFPDW